MQRFMLIPLSLYHRQTICLCSKTIFLNPNKDIYSIQLIHYLKENLKKERQ